MLARQIRNLPVDEAIRQMEFSDKRSAKKILHNLAFARKNAADQKGMENMVVCKFVKCEVWDKITHSLEQHKHGSVRADMLDV